MLIFNGVLGFLTDNWLIEHNIDTPQFGSANSMLYCRQICIL